EPDRDADGRERGKVRGEVSDWAAFDEFSERQKSAHRHEVPPDTPLSAARRLKGVGRGHRVLPISAVGGSPWRLRGVIPRKKARRGGGRPPGPKRSRSSPARARRSSSSRSPSRSCSSLGAGTGSSATRNGRSSLWLLLPRRPANRSCL